MASVKRSSTDPDSEGPGPSTKRAKTEESFSFPTSFEDELAFLESVEQEEKVEATNSDPSDSQSSQGSQRRKWKRPPPPSIDPSSDSVTFQQIEIDHYIGEHIPGMPGVQGGSGPILRMFGVTMTGNSVCAHVHGFLPYFYVPAPSDSFTTQHCDHFRRLLDEAVMGDMRSNRDGIKQAVLAVEIFQRCSMYGFHYNKMFPFLKITLASPKLVAPARRLISSVNIPPFGQVSYLSFESNIEFEVRFMVDTGVVGCNWIECPPGKYKLRKPIQYQNGMEVCPNTGFTTIGKGARGGSVTSKCQIELDISWEDFVSHPAEGEWQKIAPLRILSFDIECAGRKGIFPEAERDPVIQIANMVVSQGEKAPFIRNVFTLNSCSSIVGSEVISFQKERDLLQVYCSILCISQYTHLHVHTYMYCIHHVSNITTCCVFQLCQVTDS